jgi:hypothetical protein
VTAELGVGSAGLLSGSGPGGPSEELGPFDPCRCMYQADQPVVLQPRLQSLNDIVTEEVGMLDNISAGADGSTTIEVVAVLVPTLVLLWIILTVTALHK